MLFNGISRNFQNFCFCAISLHAITVSAIFKLFPAMHLTTILLEVANTNNIVNYNQSRGILAYKHQHLQQ